MVPLCCACLRAISFSFFPLLSPPSRNLLASRGRTPSTIAFGGRGVAVVSYRGCQWCRRPELRVATAESLKLQEEQEPPGNSPELRSAEAGRARPLCTCRSFCPRPFLPAGPSSDSSPLAVGKHPARAGTGYRRPGWGDGWPPGFCPPCAGRSRHREASTQYLFPPHCFAPSPLANAHLPTSGGARQRGRKAASSGTGTDPRGLFFPQSLFPR